MDDMGKLWLTRGFDLGAVEDDDLFGADSHSLVNIIDFRLAGDYKLAQLGKAYADFFPTWVIKEPTGSGLWTHDWMALQARWAKATVASRSTSSSVALSLPFANTTGAYNDLQQALEGGLLPQKGGFTDLVDRITKAGGKVDLSGGPKPTPTLMSLIPGAQWAADHLPDHLPSPDDLVDPLGLRKWWAAHGKTAMWVGAGVLGLWVLGNVYAMIKLAPVAAKAAPTIIKMLPMAAL